MNENSSQTIKELSEDQEIKNSSELDNDSASQNEEDLSFENSDIPSADSSSSRTNTDFDNSKFCPIFCPKSPKIGIFRNLTFLSRNKPELKFYIVFF